VAVVLLGNLPMVQMEVVVVPLLMAEAEAEGLVTTMLPLRALLLQAMEVFLVVEVVGHLFRALVPMEL
jgi:hypothetical protein